MNFVYEGQLFESLENQKIINSLSLLSDAVGKNIIIEGIVNKIENTKIFITLPCNKDVIIPVEEIASYQSGFKNLIQLINKKIQFVLISEDDLGFYGSRKKAEKLVSDYIINNYQVGTVVNGKVKSISEKFASIEIGAGFCAHLRISNFCIIRLENFNEILKIDQNIKVVIQEIDKDKNRISVSTLPLFGDFEQNIAGLNEGDVVYGIIRNSLNGTNSGTFIQLKLNLAGLVDEYFPDNYGQVGKFLIKSINRSNFKIKLQFQNTFLSLNNFPNNVNKLNYLNDVNFIDLSKWCHRKCVIIENKKEVENFNNEIIKKDGKENVSILQQAQNKKEKRSSDIHDSQPPFSVRNGEFTQVEFKSRSVTQLEKAIESQFIREEHLFFTTIVNELQYCSSLQILKYFDLILLHKYTQDHISKRLLTLLKNGLLNRTTFHFEDRYCNSRIYHISNLASNWIRSKTIASLNPIGSNLSTSDLSSISKIKQVLSANQALIFLYKFYQLNSEQIKCTSQNKNIISKKINNCNYRIFMNRDEINQINYFTQIVSRLNQYKIHPDLITEILSYCFFIEIIRKRDGYQDRIVSKIKKYQNFCNDNENSFKEIFSSPPAILFVLETKDDLDEFKKILKTNIKNGSFSLFKEKKEISIFVTYDSDTFSPEKVDPKMFKMSILKIKN